MKILVYSANFAPEQTGIGKYSGEMAAWFAEKGYQVRVVSAPPYYPQWKIYPEYRGWRFQKEQWRGVDVWRTPLWVPKSPGGLKRVLHLLSFAFGSFPVMLYQTFWRPDWVIVVAPAFVCAPAALLAARLSGARSWIHMQDFEVDIAFRMKLLRGAWLQRVFLRIERWILKRFDVVSSISQRMVSRLLEKGIAPERIEFFPNWVDMRHIRPSAASQGYREELGIDAGATIVLYSGTLGNKQGLMVIPEVARILAARRDIVFVICGEGVMKATLQSACAGLPNTRVIPLQPFHRLGDLLCAADVHLLPQSLEAEDLVLPSKLSGMLASGRPVVVTCQAGTELDTVVSNCGVVVEPEDSAALARAINQLADDPVLRAKLGDSGRKYAALHFDRDAVLARIARHLNGGSDAPQMDHAGDPLQNDVVA